MTFPDPFLLMALTAAPSIAISDPWYLEQPSRAAQEVVAFWRAAGPGKWFAKDADFDRRFRERFLDLHEMAAAGQLDYWLNSQEGALALVILLDQFPRNAFRGEARMYATDVLARQAAEQAIARGFDRAAPVDMQKFFYLPFAHSEALADQDRSVALCRRLGGFDFSQATHHREIVRRFGRFPHRNPILGRTMRAEEAAWLAAGGYAG